MTAVQNIEVGKTDLPQNKQKTLSLKKVEKYYLKRHGEKNRIQNSCLWLDIYEYCIESLFVKRPNKILHILFNKDEYIFTVRVIPFYITRPI